MPLYPYSGLYDPIGFARRNGLLRMPEANPLPESIKSNDTGNAGLDGYTVLSRADRHSGERPIANCEPFFEGPKNLPEESGT